MMLQYVSKTLPTYYLQKKGETYLAMIFTCIVFFWLLQMYHYMTGGMCGALLHMGRMFLYGNNRILNFLQVEMKCTKLMHSINVKAFIIVMCYIIEVVPGFMVAQKYSCISHLKRGCHSYQLLNVARFGNIVPLSMLVLCMKISIFSKWFAVKMMMSNMDYLTSPALPVPFQNFPNCLTNITRDHTPLSL